MEIDGSCLLLGSENFNFCLNSFILFFIVFEVGSFWDLLVVNECYFSSIELSFIFFVRVFEIRIDSCINSCVKLEIVKEMEVLDFCVVSENFNFKDLVFFIIDFDEKWLSMYFWNLIGS